MKLAADELREYFTDKATPPELELLAKEITNHSLWLTEKIEYEKRIAEHFDTLDKARKNIAKALNLLEEAKEAFPPETYTSLVKSNNSDSELFKLGLKLAESKTGKSQLNHDDIEALSKLLNLEDVSRQVFHTIPAKKPKGIQKKTLELFFGTLHLLCEKVNPHMDWYSYSDIDGKYTGNFFSICRLIMDKLNIHVADSTIHKYLRDKAKPHRETMTAVIEELKQQNRPPIILGMPQDELDNLKAKVQKTRKK
ncbi:MAG: hypothetical protein K6L73_02435 [Cellvibrionaceae bacterium]